MLQIPPRHVIITPEKGLGRLRCIPIPTHSRVFMEMTYCIRILLPPSPLFHKEKRSIVKRYKLPRKFQQISGFLLNTSEFFSKIFGGGGATAPPAPPLATALRLLEWFSVECRKTKTKVITLANHKEHTQYSEPIKTRRNYR